MSDVEDGILDDDAVQRIAEIELASSQSAKQTILEEHSASYRWLMASLLAVNAGGLLTLKDAAQMAPEWRIASLVSFYVGTLLALAIAWLGQRAGRAMLTPLTELIGFWVLVSSTRFFDPAKHAEVIAQVQASMSISFRSRIAGWGSVLAFSSGLLCLAIGTADTREVSRVPIEKPTVQESRDRNAK